MEQKSILISVLSVGVGLGIGLASGQSVTKWGASTYSSNAITPQKMEHEMLRLVVDGRESNVTFDQFPYYLSEQTRVLLTNAAYVHLKHAEVSKYTRNLAPASQTERYQIRLEPKMKNTREGERESKRKILR